MYAGRNYIRFGTWNPHNTELIRYPTKRHFVIPVEYARGLVAALQAAIDEKAGRKPQWLVDVEEEQPQNWYVDGDISERKNARAGLADEEINAMAGHPKRMPAKTEDLFNRMFDVLEEMRSLVDRLYPMDKTPATALGRAWWDVGGRTGGSLRRQATGA